MQTNLTIKLQEVRESIGVSQIAIQEVKKQTETVLDSKLAMMKCQSHMLTFDDNGGRKGGSKTLKTW